MEITYTTKQKPCTKAEHTEKTAKFSQPSKKQFEEATELVEKVRIRDRFLEEFSIELSTLLQQFSLVVFKKYPKTSGFIFSGVIDNKLKVGVSKCDNLDYFVDVIGKLIAVRRALNIEIKTIDDFLKIYGNILHI